MRKRDRWIAAAVVVGTTVLVCGCSRQQIMEDTKEFLTIMAVIGSIIVGVILIGVVCVALAALKDWFTAWRDCRATLRRIREVSQARLQAAIVMPESGATPIDKAVRERRVRVSAVKGDGLEHVTVSVEPAKARSSHRISFPLGLVFVANGGHQNMGVREPRVETIEKPTDCSIPVTCINFHKSVPSSRDSFESFDQVSCEVKKVLAVAKAADISPFVTQLATWIVTDGVDPSIVAIGRMFDSNSRTASKWEKMIAEAVATKSRGATL